MSGGTYGAPRIRHALMRAGVDVGVWAVAASMGRQGLTGLNVHWRPTRRGLHSRRVLGRAMGEQQSADLVITTLDMAAATRGTFPAGVVPHADRGTQVTSQKLAAYMRAVTGTVSMGQATVCWDNAIAESLWAILATDYYYRRTVTPRDQVYTGVATWIEDFYNPRRIHTSLGGKSPHRIRTTPSSPDNSRFNKPSTTCTQAQCL